MKPRRQIIVFAFALLAIGSLVHPAQAATLPVVGLPKKIVIPAIGVNAKIENLGVDRHGILAVPKSAWTVGWFQHTWPGDKGNALMYGHLNTLTSPVAVFTHLNRMRVGDVIKVTDSRGTVRTFKVTKKASYLFAQTPIAAMTAASSKSHLNLYTCAGVWNSRLHNYSRRLVVYSTLVSVKPVGKPAIAIR